MPVGDLLEPFRLLHRLGADHDAVGSRRDQVVHSLCGPDPAAYLRGHSALLHYPLEDGEVVLLAEGSVQVHQVEVWRAPGDPHVRDLQRVGHDDLLAAGDSPDQLDHLVVHHVHRGDDDQSTDSANEMKFLRNVMPEVLLFSGWNWVP